MMIKRRMMNCELCKSPARISCDADQARLCWGCDAAVHAANFLVARHSRCLLCRCCQSPTPWCASGARLSPTTFSLCEKCVGEKAVEESGENEIGDGDEVEIVVLGRSLTPPPPATSASRSGDSSPSDEECDAQTPSISKRKRDEGVCSDFYSQGNHRRPKSRRSGPAPVLDRTIMREVDTGGADGGDGNAGRE
ncbi:B-box domain protein 31-like protein [Drosera capensis]